MDNQDSGGGGASGARSARVEREMAAARALQLDTRSEAQVAPDTATERLLAGLSRDKGETSDAPSGAEEGTAPAVRAGARREPAHGHIERA